MGNRWSLGSTSETESDRCAICLGALVRGQGARFTAECYHTFHLSCIAAIVAQGNHNCPLCRARWSVLPAVNAPLPPLPSATRYTSPPSIPEVPDGVYDDDEPVENTSRASHRNGVVVLKTHCEYAALARDASRDRFAVLVYAKAPAVAANAGRAPLDLVTVLDVSGSMAGRKLALLKQAMGFVIDNLGSADRLSVVSFSSGASRLIHLARMSDAGKAWAKLAVQSLVAGRGTNIGEGLRVAARVLEDRRYRNAVASIILLSDGQDTYASRGAYMDLVPRSFRHTRGGAVPIHAFGFGTDHDAAAMHGISEATGGTFSFIENQAAIQDSFAQCIGGLLSVVVQEVRIAVTCCHPGVRVREVKSGCYDNRVDDDGRAASIHVGELYADEERRFLMLVDVPRAEPTDDVTRLLKVSATYRDAAAGQAVDIVGEDAVVQRPVEVTHMDISMDVERERVRVAATEDIAAAREVADRGEHSEAARILESRLETVEQSAPGMAHDPTCDELMDELRDLGFRVADRREYQLTGRACLLSGMSSHTQQRASPMQLWTAPAASGWKSGSMTKECARKTQGYMTPTMEKLVMTSRELRQTTTAPMPKRKHVNVQQPAELIASVSFGNVRGEIRLRIDDK
ncbi:E3 ubiquitin-protein ligase WAV3-like [Lolium rigidum]|uniref:E3 ubiquitin-protein ligase WAV3-like n=1 Tax=Lolium rigidum TaxID=89674 RepID=UPI001F5C0AD8|nr:E3 ubiquitin-protein ligase WAV3-like [Lolium rigidum]